MLTRRWVWVSSVENKIVAHITSANIFFVEIRLAQIVN